MALKNIGIEYELIGFSEVDEYAIKSYCHVHNINENLNLGDITKIEIDKLPTNIDLITHGSPCQSFSSAGLQHGGDRGSGTRSSLMWNTVEIISYCKPKYVIWENVKNVLSKKHKHNFEEYLSKLETLGYTNYYNILNAKDYGVAQNRERIFVVSILENTTNKKYNIFNNSINKTVNIKDILDNNGPFEYLKEEEYTILEDKLCKTQSSGLIFKGYRNKNIRKVGVKPDTYHLSRTHKQPNRIYSASGTHPTLSSQEISGRYYIHMDNSVRKLTLKECFKLMGMSSDLSDDLFKIGITKSQQYKIIGNSIVVPILEEIFKNLLL